MVHVFVDLYTVLEFFRSSSGDGTLWFTLLVCLRCKGSTFDNDGASGSNEHTLSLPPR